MNFLVEFFLFWIGVLLGIWRFGSVFLPILYGFPRGLYWAFRGWAKWRAPFIYLVSPVLWSVALIVITLVLFIFTPKVATYLTQSRGFAIGQFVGIGLLIVRVLFSRSTHIDMADDFYAFMGSHLTPAGATMVGVLSTPGSSGSSQGTNTSQRQ